MGGPVTLEGAVESVISMRPAPTLLFPSQAYAAPMPRGGPL